MSNFDEIFQTYQGYKFIDGDKPINGYESMIGVNKTSWQLEDFALVHATDFFPNGKILNNYDGKKSFEGFLYVGEDKKKYKYVHARKTVHFSLNGRVSPIGTGVGNWESCPYIIIEPLKNQINNIACLRLNDTYTKSSVKLSDDAVYLINKKKFDEMNPDLLKNKNVVVFTGDSYVATNEILMSLGYNPQIIGEHNWISNRDELIINANNGIENLTNRYSNIENNLSHSSSKYNSIEYRLTYISQLLSSFMNGVKIDLSDKININYKMIQYLYNFYLCKQMQHYFSNCFAHSGEKKDDINAFSNFVKDFNMDYDGTNYYIHKIDDFYNFIDNKMNELQIKQLYGKLKKLENEEIEHKRQIREQKIQEFKNSIKERMLNMTCEQAVKLCHKFPNYKTQFIRMLHNLLEIDFSLENVGIPKKNKISYNYLMKYISVRIDDDNFFYYLSDISEFKNHYDECLRMEVDLSNMKISEIREILFKYQQYIYEQANKYISNENIKDSVKKMGYIKISYIVILLSIFLIIVFIILLVLLFQ